MGVRKCNKQCHIENPLHCGACLLLEPQGCYVKKPKLASWMMRCMRPHHSCYLDLHLDTHQM